MLNNCKKVSFATEKDAIYYIDKLKKTSIRSIIPTRSYLCTKCINWHLTSKGSYENRKIKELELLIKLLREENKILKSDFHKNAMIEIKVLEVVKQANLNAA